SCALFLCPELHFRRNACGQACTVPPMGSSPRSAQLRTLPHSDLFFPTSICRQATAPPPPAAPSAVRSCSLFRCRDPPDHGPHHPSGAPNNTAALQDERPAQPVPGEYLGTQFRG